MAPPNSMSDFPSSIFRHWPSFMCFWWVELAGLKNCIAGILKNLRSQIGANSGARSYCIKPTFIGLQNENGLSFKQIRYLILLIWYSGSTLNVSENLAPSRQRHSQMPRVVVWPKLYSWNLSYSVHLIIPKDLRCLYECTCTLVVPATYISKRLLTQSTMQFFYINYIITVQGRQQDVQSGGPKHNLF